MQTEPGRERRLKRGCLEHDELEMPRITTAIAIVTDDAIHDQRRDMLVQYERTVWTGSKDAATYCPIP
jgi:hypothetical protein